MLSKCMFSCHLVLKLYFQDKYCCHVVDTTNYFCAWAAGIFDRMKVTLGLSRLLSALSTDGLHVGSTILIFIGPVLYKSSYERALMGHFMQPNFKCFTFVLVVEETGVQEGKLPCLELIETKSKTAIRTILEQSPQSKVLSPKQKF